MVTAEGYCRTCGVPAQVITQIIGGHTVSMILHLPPPAAKKK